MSVSNIRNAELEGINILHSWSVQFWKATLAGQITIGKDYPPFAILDPGGASRDVLLPAEADSAGLLFHFINTADAAEDLTIKEDSDTTTIVTISQNERGWVFCDGTSWYGVTGGIT